MALPGATLRLWSDALVHDRGRIPFESGLSTRVGSDALDQYAAETPSAVVQQPPQNARSKALRSCAIIPTTPEHHRQRHSTPADPEAWSSRERVNALLTARYYVGA
jgi:hypothetical protein